MGKLRFTWSLTLQNTNHWTSTEKFKNAYVGTDRQRLINGTKEFFVSLVISFLAVDYDLPREILGFVCLVCLVSVKWLTIWGVGVCHEKHLYFILFSGGQR